MQQLTRQRAESSIDSFFKTLDHSCWHQHDQSDDETSTDQAKATIEQSDQQQHDRHQKVIVASNTEETQGMDKELATSMLPSSRARPADDHQH